MIYNSSKIYSYGVATKKKFMVGGSLQREELF